MADFDCLLIGHITADLIPNGRILGGTPSYAAHTLKQFDLRVAAIISAREDDPLLPEIRQDVDKLIVIPADETTTYENVYKPEGRTQYVHHLASRITVNDIPQELTNTPFVFISPMAGEVDEDVVSLFADSHVLITPQGWMRKWGDDKQVRFKRWYSETVLKAANTFVMSEEDIKEAPDIRHEYAKVAQNLVITNDEKGGTYYVNGERRTYDGFEVEATELTGAGDVFAASLLAGLMKLNDIDKAIRFAAILAAYSVTRAGIDGAPTAEEIEFAFKQVERENPI